MMCCASLSSIVTWGGFQGCPSTRSCRIPSGSSPSHARSERSKSKSKSDGVRRVSGGFTADDSRSNLHTSVTGTGGASELGSANSSSLIRLKGENSFIASSGQSMSSATSTSSTATVALTRRLWPTEMLTYQNWVAVTCSYASSTFAETRGAQGVSACLRAQFSLSVAYLPTSRAAGLSPLSLEKPPNSWTPFRAFSLHDRTMSGGSRDSNFGNEHVPLSPAAPPSMAGSKGNLFACLEKRSNMVPEPSSASSTCPDVAEIRPRGGVRAAIPTLETTRRITATSAPRIATDEARGIGVSRTRLTEYQSWYQSCRV